AVAARARPRAGETSGRRHRRKRTRPPLAGEGAGSGAGARTVARRTDDGRRVGSARPPAAGTATDGRRDAPGDAGRHRATHRPDREVALEGQPLPPAPGVAVAA